MRIWFLTFFLVFLISCAPMADGRQQTADGGQPTATPLSTPTATPTVTPTPTVIPTPTPTPLPHPAAFDDAFARGLIRYENGQWLVTAVQTADGGRQTADFLLLPDTFNTHDDLRTRNPLAPLTVRALSPLPLGDPLTGAGGPGVREHTLLWNPDTAEFRLAYTFPTLFEGIGTDSPRLIEENLDAIPFIPIEDIQNGLAAQSVLLAMQEDGYQPFDEEAVKAYAKLGGYSLLFELKNGYKTADLKSWVNWTRSADYPNDGKGINYHTVSMKLSPYWMRTAINGQTYDVPALVLLNPQDAQNPQPNEFLVVFGLPHTSEIMDVSSLTNAYALKNPLIPSRIHLYATNPNLDPKDPNTIVIPNPSNPDNPALLDDRDPFQSLLARLLGIEGNDASRLEYVPGYAHFPVEFNVFIPQLDNSHRIAETNPFPVPLLPQIQQMIFLFEVGVAR